MMKTPAEQCRDQGRVEGETKGRAEGEAKGRAEALLKLMQLKFGAVPGHVSAAIGAGSIAQLDRWIAHVLTATSAAEVVSDE